MESKTEKCKDCIYFTDPMFAADCDACVEHSNFISEEKFYEDMDFWNEEPENEADKPQYFLIRWLINILTDALVEEGLSVRFLGIGQPPKGTKQDCEIQVPFWLRPFFLKEWCHQWRNGGYTGDDYAGTLYYKLLPFVYLKFAYQC